MASRLQDVLLRGLASARPAATAVANGTLYFATDTSVTTQSDGAAWNPYSAAGGGGGGGTSTGTEAAIPAASTAGALYLPSDGAVLRRDTGSAWVPWGPIFPFTAPVSSAFAWVNQGTATIDTTKGGVHLSAPGTASGAFNLVGRFKAVTPPYTITAHLLCLTALKTWTGYGLFFRQASDGKLVGMNIGANSTLPTGYGLSCRAAKITSPTAFSGDYATAELPLAAPVSWLRIADDNTNRIMSLSMDGQHWQVFHTVARTDFLTATEVGFAAITENTATPNRAVDLTLLSWLQT